MSLATITRRAWPALISILTLWPGLLVLLEWRDVDLLDFSGAHESALVTVVGRIGVVSVLVLSGIVLAFGPLKERFETARRNRARGLLFALIIFMVGHSLLPAFFGAVPSFETQTVYAFVVLYAAYASRKMPIDRFLNALKISLLVLIVSGLLAAVVAPNLALQYVDADVRLPIIQFRYWGLGSNPNNIAPLALTLLLLTVHQPFKSKAATGLSYAAGMVTLVLAQSQTTWTAALLVLPLFALFTWTSKPIRKARIDPVLLIVVIVSVAAGLMLIIWEAAHFNLAEITGSAMPSKNSNLIGADGNVDVGNFTGRAQIWEIAIQTWKDHPIFGYGPTVWGREFREMIGLSFAYNAHNQVMQSASVGGWVALIALIVYLLAMVRASIRSNGEASRLATAMLVIMVVRGFTEGPLDTNTLFSGEVLLHTALLHLMFHGLAAKVAPVKSRRRQRRSRERGVAIT